MSHEARTETSNLSRWIVPMRLRSPDEAHRAATPLELLFDLVFVVAVAQSAAALYIAVWPRGISPRPSSAI